MREIKFRGKRLDNGEWVYGDVWQHNERVDIVDRKADSHPVDPKTVGQYTGLKDENGTEIYEGDIVRIRRPGRDEQTHYGDNIPLGSYTEPLEPVVTEEVVSVVFADGGFGYVQTADKPHYTIEDSEIIPLSWLFYEITATNEDELKQLFASNWGDRILDGWDEDKEYLFETYNVKSVEELINYIGIEIIGNRWDNPEPLEREGA